MKKFLIFFIVAGLTVPILFASAVTGTIDATNKYAWSNNMGWINFGCTNCNVQVKDAFITGYAWSVDYGWINLAPTLGGVHNNGLGVLSGYAWGANIGWINFTGVSINSSGYFTGTATGDNIGTLNFDCTETGCPVTTDWRPAHLTFNLSDTSIGFGQLSSSAARYATSSAGGSSSDTADALTFSVSTNAASGYTVTIDGSTLTHGASTISAIGGTAVASLPGTKQFGIRLIKNSGTGSTSAPYDTSDWALDTGAFPDEIATGIGDNATTVFGVRSICNISPTTSAGNYTTSLIFTVNATF